MASDQAETYLRLMAETELRHALAQPKVREPRHPVSTWLSPDPPRRFRLRLRTVRAAWYAYRSFAAGLRQRPGGAYDGLRRVAAAADALTAVDAVDEEVAMKVMADQQIALELRQRVHPAQLHGWRMLAYGPGRHGLGARAASRPPTGSFYAAGVAKRTGFELDGDPVDVTLLALVIAPDRAVLTITANRQSELDDDEMMFLDSVTAIDDHGGRYSLSFSGSGGDEWAGELEMHPVPRPGVQWLDLTFAPGTRPVRINLDQVTPAEPAIEPLPRSELAERYLDRVAERLFEGQDWAGTSWSDGVTALLDAGLITLDNPAISRLATLARRLGASLPSDLADRPETDFPDRWRSVLNASGAEDGPTGIAPAVAVLPEFDGRRWVIAGLRSAPYSVELEVFGWGTDPHRNFHHGMEMPTGIFSWWARDDTGRWHVAGTDGGSWGDMHTDYTLRFTPALHPAATSIDVVLIGQTGRVTVTLPLDWAQVDRTQP